MWNIKRAVLNLGIVSLLATSYWQVAFSQNEPAVVDEQNQSLDMPLTDGINDSVVSDTENQEHDISEEPVASAASIEAMAATGIISNAASEQAFKYQLNSYLGETGWVVKRSEHYEYGPAVIKADEDTVHMWFCGGGGKGASGGDSIWYSRTDNYGQWNSWTTPVEVIRPSTKNAYLDYAHACDPSVTWHGGYYYVMYTGAPDWRPNGQTCSGAGGPIGCDNRIFVARVPETQVAQPTAYAKLVNVGDCTSSSCFQWKGFWDVVTESPPVPIVRYESVSVWRKDNPGKPGNTTRQTDSYGIGQPSQLSVNAKLEIWFTSQNSQEGLTRVWSRTDSDIANPYLLQEQESGGYTKRVSNNRNDVNYEVAYLPGTGFKRYVATIAREGGPETHPCVHMAHKPGLSLTTSNPNNPDAINEHIISRNLGDQSTCFLMNAEPNAHNVGFLRDKWGYLVTMKGRADGPYYQWVYYGTNRQLLGTNPGQVDINRVPFSIAVPPTTSATAKMPDENEYTTQLFLPAISAK